ncbi:choice-of-anchor A domain-containing protein [Alteromonadaceae bacterium Bs31]|nr:choice-of-anchor A domain-containing protein [Alteromonadaceae bacterium Bs31]
MKVGSSFKKLALAAGMVLATQAHSIGLPLEDYNLIVAGDYTHEGGSVWGSAFIGGNLLGGASEFASRIVDAEMDSLKVVGEITASHVKVQTGNLVVKNKSNISTTSTVEIQNHSSEIVEDAGLSIASVMADLQAASSNYQGMASNASFSNGKFSYSGTDKIAVYNANADELFGKDFNFDFSAVSADNLIINVSGKDISADKFNMNPGPYAASKILWNFYQAEDITVNRSILGSLLAVNAYIDLNARVDGSVAAGSLATSAQIHNWNFEQVVSPVPLPGTLILLGSVLLGFGAYRRRVMKKTA